MTDENAICEICGEPATMARQIIHIHSLSWEDETLEVPGTKWGRCEKHPFDSFWHSEPGCYYFRTYRLPEIVLKNEEL